jgi:hypothetical protein
MIDTAMLITEWRGALLRVLLPAVWPIISIKREILGSHSGGYEDTVLLEVAPYGLVDRY